MAKKPFNVRSDGPALPSKGSRLGISRSAAGNMTMPQDANYGYAASLPKRRGAAVKGKSNKRGILG